MTRMLAIEWADKNIRVNAIAPTTVMTQSREQLLATRRYARSAGAHSARALRTPRRSRPRWLSGEPRRDLDHRADARRRRRADGGLSLAVTMRRREECARAPRRRSAANSSPAARDQEKP